MNKQGHDVRNGRGRTCLNGKETNEFRKKEQFQSEPVQGKREAKGKYKVRECLG